MRPCLLWFSVLLLVVACGGAGQRSAIVPYTPEVVEGPDGRTLDVLRLLPPDTDHFLAFRPARWAEVRAAWEMVTGVTPRRLGEPLASVASQDSALAALAALADLEPAGWDRVAALVDPGRPILVVPFRYDLAEARPFVHAGLVAPPPLAPRGTESVAVLPTGRPDELAAALSAALPADADGVAYRVVAHPDAVVALRYAQFVPSPAVLAAEADRALARATPGFVPPTAAAFAHAAHGGALGAWLSTAALDPLAIGSGYQTTLEALAEFDGRGDSRGLSLQLWDGVSAVMGTASWLVRSAPRAVTDVGLSLRGTGRVSVDVVSSLSPTGRGMLAVATHETTPAPRAAWPDAIYRLSLDADLPAVVDAAPLPVWAVCDEPEERSHRSGNMGRFFLECGAACYANLLLDGPWSTMRGLHTVSPGELGTDVVPLLPRTLRMAGRLRDGRMEFGGAAVLPRPVPEKLRQWLKGLQVGAPEIAYEEWGDGAVTRFSWGARGRDAYPGEPLDEAPNALLTAALDASALAPALDDLDAETRQSLTRLGDVRARLVGLDDTLVFQLAFGGEPGAPSELAAPPRYRVSAATAPETASPTWPPEPGERCLVCAPFEARPMIDATAHVAPAKRAEFTARAAQEVQEQLESCLAAAAGHEAPAASTRVRALRRALARTVAWSAAARWDVATSQRFLAAACSAGHADSCQGLRGPKAGLPPRVRPAVGLALPTVPESAGLATPHARGRSLVVGEAGVLWDGVAGALGDGWPLPDPPTGQTGVQVAGPLTLAIAADTPARIWAPEFQRAAESGHRAVRILVSSRESPPSVFSALLPEAPKRDAEAEGTHPPAPPTADTGTHHAREVLVTAHGRVQRRDLNVRAIPRDSPSSALTHARTPPPADDTVGAVWVAAVGEDVRWEDYARRALESRTHHRSAVVVLGPAPPHAQPRERPRLETAPAQKVQGKSLLRFIGTRGGASGGLGVVGSGAGGGVGRIGGIATVHRGKRVGTVDRPAVGGGLSKDVIKRQIQRVRPKISGCYERLVAEKGDDAPEGKITVSFVIGVEGRVTSAEASRDSVGDEALAACLLDAVREITFPKPKNGDIVKITYPFIFKAK